MRAWALTWLVGGGQVLVRRRVLDDLHEAEGERGGRPAPFASRPGGRATASRSAAAGGSTSAHSLLDGSGGSDAAGAAVAWLLRALRCDAVWRAFSVASAAQGLTICEQLEIHEPYVEEPWADGSNADEDPFNTRKL
eukprot:scaffold52173_cov45-Phaeocystis_antarctica.AAC.2